MYLAQTNTQQTQAPFYVNILKNIIANKAIEEKADIDSAIIEAKEIANGQRDIFSVNNDHYFLVTTLLTRFKERLLSLQGNDFDKNTYSDIIDVLK